MAQIDRDDLVRYLDELLHSPGKADDCPNGLQVEGAQRVSKVVTGVSACLDLFQHADAVGADTVLVHHGIFWKGDPQQLTGWRMRRLAALVRPNLSLIAYHLPLDRHAELGNNALAARAFGLRDLVPFGDYEGEPVGFAGRFPAPIPPSALVQQAENVFGQAPLAFLEGPEEVSSLALVSGGAQRLIHQALDEGWDAYLTGEASEWVMNIAREGGIHFLAAGHYATERLGIRALGDHLADRFGLEVEFVDVPNPV
ncbi:MAG: Nif3-like dinuclear metal center hexameric protein [Thermoanaerobaculia bacterium]